MNFLSDVISYIRRIIKSQSNQQISDALLIDYINRFWISDVDARMQLFDLKVKYQFQTTPGVDQYNMPLYNPQTELGAQTIGMYPVYQGFLGNGYINGIQVPVQTQKNSFFNIYPNVLTTQNALTTGTGVLAPYTLNVGLLGASSGPNPPLNALLRGHVDISGIIATGVNVDPPTGNLLNTSIPTSSLNPGVYITSIDATGANVVVTDSGQFLSGDPNYGLLMTNGNYPTGNTALTGGYSTTSNTVNYLTGVINVNFPVAIPLGNNINVQCYFFQGGLPRSILYYNNTLTLRSPPSTQYLVELDCYLSPAAFFDSSAALPFAYMAEYIARGAARKILSDTGDIEQFMFYEPLFKEQELLVWKRSQRQFTANRTETLYSQGFGQGFGNANSTLGGGTV